MYYIYICIYHLHTSFTHWPSNWGHVIHIPHTHFTSWPSHWAYDTFAPYTLLLYGPVTGLASYIYHIARIATAQFIASHHTCTKYTQLLPHGPVTGLTSCIRHIDTTVQPGSVFGLISYRYHKQPLLLGDKLKSWQVSHQIYQNIRTIISTTLGSHDTYTTYRQLLLSGPVTGLIWYNYPIHTTFNLWPSNWAYIRHLSHRNYCHYSVNRLKSYVDHKRSTFIP